MKKRINISIGAKLHAAATAYAKSREMDFSQLLDYLLRRELENPSVSTLDALAAKKRIRMEDNLSPAGTSMLNDPESGSKIAKLPPNPGSSASTSYPRPKAKRRRSA